MSQNQIPTPNTYWVLMIKGKDKVESVQDWLEELGCEVAREIAPIPLNNEKFAIGTLGPPNLDDYINDSSHIRSVIDSASPQIDSTSMM